MWLSLICKSGLTFISSQHLYNIILMVSISIGAIEKFNVILIIFPLKILFFFPYCFLFVFVVWQFPWNGFRFQNLMIHVFHQFQKTVSLCSLFSLSEITIKLMIHFLTQSSMFLFLLLYFPFLGLSVGIWGISLDVLDLSSSLLIVSFSLVSNILLVHPLSF